MSTSATGQKGNSLIIVLLGILVLALIGGAYYLGTQKSQLETSVTPVEDIPSPSPNSSADWKTYKNEGVKFSIQYPQDWNLTEQKAPIGYNPAQFPGGILRVDIKGTQGSISILWGGGFGGGPCPQTHYQLQTGAGMMDFCDTTNSDNSEMLDMSNIGPSNAVSKNTITSFKISSDINSPYKTNQDEILRILATFKFTDQTSTFAPTVIPVPTLKPDVTLTYSLPSGWQVLDSSKYGFSIGYDKNTWSTGDCPMSSTIPSCTIILQNSSPWQYNFSIFPAPYTGGSIKSAIQDRWNIGSSFNIQIDGKVGVLAITNPTHSGENKIVVIVMPVGDQLLYFTTDIISNVGTQTSGYDMDYVYKVFSTIQFH